MCSECLQRTCAGACPNAPEPKRVYLCYCCGNDIRIGDEYYHAEAIGEVFCTDCITKRTAEED